MLKRSLFLLIVAMLLTVEATSAYAVPWVPEGEKLEMYTYWLKQSDWIWGCDLMAAHGTLQNCTKTNHPNTIWQKGCALSSLAMLYQYYGISWIPDTNYKPDLIGGGSSYSSLPGDLTPGHLNDWLVDHNGYDGRRIQWNNAVNSLYYQDWPEEGDNTRFRRNYICSVKD